MTPTPCPKHGGLYHPDNCRCPDITTPEPKRRSIKMRVSSVRKGEPVIDCPTCHGTGTLSGECSEADGTEFATTIYREEPCPDCKLEGLNE